MELLIILLVIVFGVSKAICDISESSFANSKLGNLNPLFWDKHKSWRNKWKDGVATNGERFFGSSTFLVWITDAWHLFNLISYVSLILTGILITKITDIVYLYPLPLIIGLIVFELFYRFLKHK